MKTMPIGAHKVTPDYGSQLITIIQVSLLLRGKDLGGLHKSVDFSLTKKISNSFFPPAREEVNHQLWNPDTPSTTLQKIKFVYFSYNE